MKAVYNRCAGLDVHKNSVFVCIRCGKGKKLEVFSAVFGTSTEDLLAMREFLRQHRVKRVAMESTGVYWIPIWNVLERGKRYEVVLVNPQHVRALPGRKTDQQDCERLAELAQYDLLRGSMIPPPEVRELRDLTRLRVKQTGERNRIVNRIARLLETSNYKLSTVVSSITGKTGMAILRALANGEKNPERLAGLAQGSLRRKKAELVRALRGYSSEHFRWMLVRLLSDLDVVNGSILEVEDRIETKMLPHAGLIQRLCTIPGVQKTTAWSLIAELGLDMSRFPSPGHAASWAGLCPGQNESAGKRQSGRTRKGDRYLRRALVQSAWAVTGKKDCFLTSLFFRVAQRRGMKKAAMAVAHRVLVIAFCIMRDGSVYREAGGDYHDRLHPERTVRRLTERLERMGLEVAVTGSPRRGRPCLCAQRGIPCSHLDRSPKPPRQTPTKRWPKIPRPDAASRELCPKCANWGIPCIHAAKQKLIAEKKLTAENTEV